MKDFLKKVLGKDEKFYELLEASADEAQKSAKSLSKLYAQVGKPDFEQCFTELVVARRVDKRIGLSITQELCQTFVTPLEREDIEALANALYKIPKTCEKIGERLAICPSQFSTDIVDKQVRMLEQATEVTASLVRKLRKLSNVEEIQDDYETLQTIEGDADRLMVRQLLRRDPRSRYRIAAHDASGAPSVLVNAPLRDDGTPMPTRYYLVGEELVELLGQLQPFVGQR